MLKLRYIAMICVHNGDKHTEPEWYNLDNKGHYTKNLWFTQHYDTEHEANEALNAWRNLYGVIEVKVRESRF